MSARARLLLVGLSGVVLMAAAPPVSRPSRAGGLPSPRQPEVTRCLACHSTAGWDDGRFDHAKTGFALLGEHRRAHCKDGHTQNFSAPLPRGCAGCHHDVHGGDLGGQCQGCHDENSWKSRFTADAHRRTNFPLFGRHALLPCEECHAQTRELRFSRPTVECVGCHLEAYQRTSATFDHLRMGLGTNCRACHDGWRWKPARLPSHDLCFEISAGSHAGIGCLKCHTQLPVVAAVGTCLQRTTSCTGCHEHTCARTDPIHPSVLGYQCKDAKCFECHRLSVVP